MLIERPAAYMSYNTGTTGTHHQNRLKFGEMQIGIEIEVEIEIEIPISYRPNAMVPPCGLVIFISEAWCRRKWVYTPYGKTCVYDNGNAKSNSFLPKILLSKNSRKYPRYRRCWENGKKIFVFFLPFFQTAAGGAISLFSLQMVGTVIKISSCDDRRSISTQTRRKANPFFGVVGQGQGV